MKNFEMDLICLYKDIYCFVNSRINNSEYAKDITQSVMEIAIAKQDTLKKKESLKAWTMQIAYNKVKSYYNEVKKINSNFSQWEYVGEDILPIDIYNVEDIKADILNLIVTEEDIQNLMTALNRLDKKYQEVIRLNYICEYSFIEISEILNVNVNTVRTWGSRGLIKLKQEFKKIDSGEGHEAI